MLITVKKKDFPGPTERKPICHFDKYYCFGLAVMANYATNESGSYRFGSFAPVRNSSKAKWLVNGKEYMSAVADAMDAAKTEIFITDFQLNPDIFMKRPDNGIDSQHWRLDKLLLRKAEEGIRVYILLYWESKDVARMDLGSQHALSVLNHSNIEVHRHPDYYTLFSHPFSIRWSHHEKVRLNSSQNENIQNILRILIGMFISQKKQMEGGMEFSRQRTIRRKWKGDEK